MKNYKTNIIGCVLILAGLYTGITGKSSWTESSVIITIGIGFFVSKDFNVTGTKKVV
jgi:hypothetical protein